MSASLSVRHDRESCKNDGTDREPVFGWGALVWAFSDSIDHILATECVMGSRLVANMSWYRIEISVVENEGLLVGWLTAVSTQPRSQHAFKYGMHWQQMHSKC